jgi:two-component system response regulator
MNETGSLLFETAGERPDILLVEDSDDDAWVAQRAFRRRSMQGRLALARTGEEALRYLRSSSGFGRDSPKVILLDLKLPGMGGHELLKQIRADERLKYVPVVVVSSSNQEQDVHKSYRLGANSYVRKQYGQPQAGEYLVEVALYWLRHNLPPG